MKKRIYLYLPPYLSLAALSLSSCLKDSRFVDFNKVGVTVEFPFGGLNYFGADAITETPVDANGTIRQFAVTIGGLNAPTTPTTVTLAVDNTISYIV